MPTSYIPDTSHAFKTSNSPIGGGAPFRRLNLSLRVSSFFYPAVDESLLSAFYIARFEFRILMRE